MNPTSGEDTPKFEFEASPEGRERRQERAMEDRQAQDSASTKKQIKTVPTDTPAVSLPVPTVPSEPATAASSPLINAQTTDLAAHDGDLIEKQWVARAKAIVHQTQDDPYVQKKEISKAGADYIKKRFNKTIPTDGPVKS
jgi:hypothetical protein